MHTHLCVALVLLFLLVVACAYRLRNAPLLRRAILALFPAKRRIVSVQTPQTV